MSTKAMTGAGVTMTVGGTAIAQLKSVTVGSAKWSTDDVTNSGSPAAGAGVIKEVLPTILDSGECTVEGVWLYSDAGMQALMTAFNTAASVACIVTLAKGEGQATTGTTLTFSGFVTDPPYPDTIAYDKALLYKSVIKINTAVVVAYGS